MGVDISEHDCKIYKQVLHMMNEMIWMSWMRRVEV